jgi:UDP-glucose 4-epimerase
MNILITGGAGFIGSNIADACLRDGHAVVVIDNLSTGFAANVPEGAVLYTMDIRDDGIGDILARHHIDVLCHHAAQIDVRRSVADPKYDLSVNVLGSLNLIEAAVRHGLGRFVFASTGGAIYGEQEYFPADERHPTAPCSPYGITKLTVEKYLHYFRLEHGLTTTVLRYTNVYGPRQSPHGEAGVVAIFCDRMLHGREPLIHGDGLQTRDYVFVDDVVRANLLAIGMTGSATFNVCTGVESTVVDIFQNLNKGFDTPFQERHGPAKPGEQRRSVCTYASIADALGWQPRVRLEDGLLATLAFFRNRAL